jgi:hypothetical protein
MSYCSINQVTLLSGATVFKTNAAGNPQTDPGDVQAFIDRADMTIRTDLSTKINFSKVPAVDAKPYPTPEPIQNLSIYKTTELLLVYMHGPQRTVMQVTDIQWWRKQYDDLKLKIVMGAVLLQVGDTNLYQPGQAYANTDKTAPAFGDTKYGDYIPGHEGDFLGTDGR